MPHKNRAARARIENLGKATQKTAVGGGSDEDNITAPVIMLSGSMSLGTSHVAASHQSAVLFSVDDLEICDIVGALHETAMGLGDDDPESEFESDHDGQDPDGNEEDDEMTEVSALEHFAAVLQRAQDVAIAAERARECGRKRPKHYLGNSGRNQRRFHQKRRQLAARGFCSVEDWFKKPSGNTTLDEPQHNHPDTSDSEVDTDGRPEGQSDGDRNRVGRGGLGGEYPLPEEEESGSEVKSSRSGQADGPGRVPPIVPYLCREKFFEPTTSHLAAYVIQTLTLTMLTKGVGSYLHLP
jgi:hypothetical protein